MTRNTSQPHLLALSSLFFATCLGCQNQKLESVQKELEQIRAELGKYESRAQKEIESLQSNVAKGQTQLQTRIEKDLEEVRELHSPELVKQLKVNIAASDSAVESVASAKKKATNHLEELKQLLVAIEKEKEKCVAAAKEVNLLRATAGGAGRYQMICGSDYTVWNSSGRGSRAGLETLYTVAIVDTSNAKINLQVAFRGWHHDSTPEENGVWMEISPPKDLTSSVGRYMAAFESGAQEGAHGPIILRLVDTETGRMYRTTISVKPKSKNEVEKVTVVDDWKLISNPHLAN